MINPNKNHRAYGKLIEINDKMSFIELIFLKDGHKLKAWLYHKEVPKNLVIGQVYNFQARFSITQDQYMINKIGKIRKQ